MGKIDIHNYEAYLLDFSDGTLPAEQQVELELFLIQHPELDIDLAELSPFSLEKNVIQYSEKNNLKRSEKDLITESQFIGYIEQQLPLHERIHVEKSCILNPSLSKELDLYAATITKPDNSIVYSEKKALKRKPKVVWYDFSLIQYAAAACILFLIGLLVLWPGNDNENQSQQLAGKATINSGVKAVGNVPLNNQSQIAQKTSTKKVAVLKQNKQMDKRVLSPEKENVIVKDTVLHESITPEPVSSNEPLIASTVSPVTKKANQTIVQVITETEEDIREEAKETKKKGIWAMTSRALKNLNHAGVKSVNGDENSNSENTGYALTLGGLNITHKPANL